MPNCPFRLEHFLCVFQPRGLTETVIQAGNLTLFQFTLAECYLGLSPYQIFSVFNGVSECVVWNIRSYCINAGCGPHPDTENMHSIGQRERAAADVWLHRGR